MGEHYRVGDKNNPKSQQKYGNYEDAANRYNDINDGSNHSFIHVDEHGQETDVDDDWDEDYD